MKKVILTILIVVTLSGCLNKEASLFTCKLNDENFEVNITIEYSKENIKIIKQETTELIEPEIADSILIIMDSFSEKFNDINGIDTKLEFNIDETEYIYTIIFNFENLDFDKLEEIVSNSSYGPELSLINRNLVFTDYYQTLENENFSCK